MEHQNTDAPRFPAGPKNVIRNGTPFPPQDDSAIGLAKELGRLLGHWLAQQDREATPECKAASANDRGTPTKQACHAGRLPGGTAYSPGASEERDQQ